MHFPIASKNNNRYRGPIESYKTNSFYREVAFNLDYLKEVYLKLEQSSNDIDNKIKLENFVEFKNKFNKIYDTIKECNQLWKII